MDFNLVVPEVVDITRGTVELNVTRIAPPLLWHEGPELGAQGPVRRAGTR